jgi:hypothetical protein
MPHRSWLIGLFVLTSHAFPQNSFHHGTSIAIVRTEGEIVIASDSRAVDGDGKPLPDTCKIRSAGKWHLSLNAMVSTRAVDVFSIVVGVLRDQGDIADRSTAIINSLTPLLSAAVKSDPALREYALAQGSLLGITVFGSENKVLKLTSIKFVVADGGFVSYERHYCPGDCAQDGRAGVFVPSADAFKFNWNTEPLVAVRDFVQMEIDRHQVDIGPPLQILQIDRKGRAKWIEKPSICKDQR